jgi:transposase
MQLFPSLSLDQMLPHDDRARVVWAFVQTLNVDSLYEKIKVLEDTAGRSATEPRVLIALWLMATLDGIGKARELDRRCKRDIRYLWILGGLTTNYHTLSDFRVDHVEFLDQLLVDSVASLVDRGLVPLETIAQDGMRVRANAGKSSFRRKPTLQQLQKQAQDHLERLKKEAEDETNEPADAREQAAQKRAACERKDRIDEALRQYEELSKQREKRKKGDGEQTRVSTTDPDARKMKTANGGFDPAYNVQFATDGTARIIVGVEVTNEGTDGGEMPPMHQKVCETYGKTPENMLVDSAFATKESVTTVERAGTKVVSTIPRAEQLLEHGKDPHTRQSGDTDEFEKFRQRMAEPAYQELYKQRPSIAEFPNAECRNHGLYQFAVRGLRKVKAVALWHAIAFNLVRMQHLGVVGT